MPVRVMIVDDNAIARDGLRHVLSAADDMELVGEAADGTEAVGLAATLRPDVVIMDISMPVLDGIEATRRIRAQHPETRVVMVSFHGTEPYIGNAFGAGALGYLLKENMLTEAVPAIYQVLEGQPYLGAGVRPRGPLGRPGT